MNRLLIYEYINRLKYDDIVKFCNYKGISVSDNDLNIVYKYIKNDFLIIQMKFLMRLNIE